MAEGLKLHQNSRRAMADEMSIDKKDTVREGSEDSMESTPEAEVDAGATQENGVQQKRKCGRKLVCC